MPEHQSIYAALRVVHILAIMTWVGGMYFAHFFLRPALATLEPPHRLKLMHAVFRRFFSAVLVASLATVGSGIWMIGRTAKMVSQTGGNFMMPWTWTVMASLGIVMLLIFFFIRFKLFKSFEADVLKGSWPNAGSHLASIRKWVGINMMIGTLIVLIQTLFS